MTDDQRDGPRPPTDRDARRAALVSEIAARLRHLCQHMSDDEFGRLVADIAETRLRFAAIDASYPPVHNRTASTTDRRWEPNG